MTSIKRILFPVDFSVRCDATAPHVAALASHFGAEVILFHAMSPMTYLFGSGYDMSVLVKLRQDFIEETRQKLAGYLLHDFRGLQVVRESAEGEAAAEIVKYAHEHGIDLIAMPTHGFGAFRRFLLGSVTAKVLHDAHCPVWTSAHMEEHSRSEIVAIGSVACAADLGPQTHATLHFAEGLAKAYEARLTLIHVSPIAMTRPAIYYDTHVFASLTKEARAEVDKLLAAESVEADVFIEAGDPAHVIRGYTAKHRTDILVIGRGSAAEGSGRLRTHAYSIIRNSPCPVISV